MNELQMKEILRGFTIFGALSDEAVEHIGEKLTYQDLNAGTALFREGEHGSSLFLLVHGEVEVVKHARSGGDARVAMLGPGDWFGEMSVIDVQPRSATARLVAPSRVIEMKSSDLDDIYRTDVKAYALIVLNIARELSRRLRVTDGMLADLVLNFLARPAPAAG